MRTVFVAIGNTLRRDDGAAHRVLQLLGDLPDVELRQVHQLSPEDAEWLTGKDLAVFIDASVAPGPARLEAIDPSRAGQSPLAHFLLPNAVVAIARKLFGFAGQAWLCHVPGEDWGAGEGLSDSAESNCQAAAALLLDRLNNSWR